MATKTTKKPPPKDAATTGTDLAEIVEPRIPWNLQIETLYGDIGITEATWLALLDTMFPGVENVDAILMALSYAKARQIDPFKVRIYVVPFYTSDRSRQRWTIMHSIEDVRATAFRTGDYAGKGASQWGKDIEHDFKGGAIRPMLPSWCQITVYRMVHGEPRAFPGPTVWFKEAYSTAGRQTDVPNSQWTKRPRYMLEKCAEAAAIRAAFPEETGAMHIQEELPLVESDEERFRRAKDVTPEKETKPETTAGEIAEKAAETEPSDETEPETSADFEFVKADGEVLSGMDAEAFCAHICGILERLREAKNIEALVENNWDEARRLPQEMFGQCQAALDEARARTGNGGAGGDAGATEAQAPDTKPPSTQGAPAAATPAQGTMLPDQDFANGEMVANISSKLKAQETVGTLDNYWKGVVRQGHPEPVVIQCRPVYTACRQDLVAAGKI